MKQRRAVAVLVRYGLQKLRHIAAERIVAEIGAQRRKVLQHAPLSQRIPAAVFKKCQIRPGERLRRRRAFGALAQRAARLRGDFPLLLRENGEDLARLLVFHLAQHQSVQGFVHYVNLLSHDRGREGALSFVFCSFFLFSAGAMRVSSQQSGSPVSRNTSQKIFVSIREVFPRAVRL